LFAQVAFRFFAENIAGHEDHLPGGGGVDFEQALVKLLSVDPRHFPVGNNQVVLILAEVIERQLAVGGGLDLVALYFKGLAEEFQNVFLIVHQQNAFPCARRQGSGTGGGLGRAPAIGQVVREFLPLCDLLSYLEAILRVYNRYGRRDNIHKARIKVLVKSLGVEKFRDAVEAEWQLARDSAPGLLAEWDADSLADVYVKAMAS